MDQFLDFEFECKTASGKTSIWIVKSKASGGILGAIMWRGAWRKYVFRTVADCDFDGNCLREIIEFTEARTLEHKA
jgi:hypothetical protein